ncbi:MAG: hypothetical protein A2Y28_04280 [Chlamydiae bacterium GWC2_50_10]|nr:MAG: hypothetical protein A2Z85_04330 [Chlamydiae bacterium GWA2_50_15]OGN53723.1 MAG: hypothetical protein A2Y28_04280 [Chlamydiae bacterium GWC2_50_10]OGN54760.1 MAG: hypothetical protein A2098_04910 [Chlamydiae bacterium GWF2_49_8]OGN58222.1 MAG: hypothetical protein A3D18_02260 [Chlamydiae bacterium RIFCSPHIGHO2_02_FULL_49_29]OGN63366.1 MAG: hypothetical protein A3E26_01175 [Chlamydiae bacterium RIFCSPHIGHO2_12_FULL_49_32]OGN68943.1 MAG: hypothetical protein A3I15_01090 [Chlamydiae bact
MSLRILALDFGKKRIGAALSDPTHTLATPWLVLECRRSLKESVLLLKEKLAGTPLKAIVLGLPLHPSGQESELSTLARQFAAHLQEHFSLPVILWDERLTTAQAERTLKEANICRKKRAQLSDKVAAAVILQNYLDAQKYR